MLLIAVILLGKRSFSFRRVLIVLVRVHSRVAEPPPVVDSLACSRCRILGTYLLFHFANFEFMAA